MIKTIYFVTRTANRLYLRNYPVKMEQLSPDACQLAMQVTTTENDDDMSIIRVSGQTWRELLKREGLTDKMIEDWNRLFTRVQLDQPLVFVWDWDLKRQTETPEEYFERHARMIKDAGGIVLPSRR